MADVHPVESAKPIARPSAAVTVFACCISGGLLSLPATFERACLGPALLITFGAAFTTWSSLIALVLLAYIDPHIKGIDTMMGRLCGGWAKSLVEVILGVFLCGIIGGSFIIVHDYAFDELNYNKLLADVATLAVAVLVALVP